MNIKTFKIIYWISTGLVALMMIFSAYSYFTNPEVKQGFQHLGFPGYFRIELAIAKIFGAILLLVPVKTQFKEWAYAGFAFTFISAFIAHNASRDPVSNQVGPIIFLLVLALSYFTYQRTKVVN